MKHLLYILLSTLVALCFASCGKVVFEEEHDIDNQTWMRFEPEAFDFKISNVEDCYDIDATICVDTTLYLAKEFPLVVDLTSQDGEHRMFYSYIQLRDSQNHSLGKADGKYVTVKAHIKDYFYFNKPCPYHLEIKQGTSKYEIRGVSKFGVRVVKSDLKVK